MQIWSRYPLHLGCWQLFELSLGIGLSAHPCDRVSWPHVGPHTFHRKSTCLHETTWGANLVTLPLKLGVLAAFRAITGHRALGPLDRMLLLHHFPRPGSSPDYQFVLRMKFSTHVFCLYDNDQIMQKASLPERQSRVMLFSGCFYYTISRAQVGQGRGGAGLGVINDYF